LIISARSTQNLVVEHSLNRRDLLTESRIYEMRKGIRHPLMRDPLTNRVAPDRELQTINARFHLSLAEDHS
jgi:hypothetical protein